jgi:WD repeat-containing protein 35
MQQAEVLAYFQKFAEAEETYVDMDRKDLALELRKRLGNWRRVLALNQKWYGGKEKKKDAMYNEVHQKLGESYYDHQKWDKAARCLEQVQMVDGTGSTERLIDCYFRCENWAGMQRLADELPAEQTVQLNDLGDRFRRVGMCGASVDALLKAGNIKAAVDCCVLLNQWDRAVDLAQQHNFPQIESLLAEYASSMLKQNKRLEAIELYRKANKSPQAAKLLCTIAEETMQAKANPLRAKKLYVLAALELERFKKRTLTVDMSTMMGTTGGGGTRASAAQATAATLDNLMTHDQATGESKSLERPWHGAEGVHFYLLAHRQLYEGDIQAAMVTAARCMQYEDVLGTKEAASLIALTSFYNRHYGECSKAFIKLESQKGLPQAELDNYIALAVSIFARHPPQDPDSDASSRLFDTGRPACVASGRPLGGSESTLSCKVCSHKMFSRELRGSCCPLCHSKLS